MRKKRAQSILEYIIVLSAIVAAVILMARDVITPAVNNMFGNAAQLIENETGDFLAKAGTGADAVEDQQN